MKLCLHDHYIVFVLRDIKLIFFCNRTEPIVGVPYVPLLIRHKRGEHRDKGSKVSNCIIESRINTRLKDFWGLLQLHCHYENVCRHRTGPRKFYGSRCSDLASKSIELVPILYRCTLLEELDSS